MKKICSIVVFLFAVLIAYSTNQTKPKEYRKVIETVDSIPIFKGEIYQKGERADAGYANIFINGEVKKITYKETIKKNEKDTLYPGVLQQYTTALKPDSCKIYRLQDNTFLLYSLADTSYYVKGEKQVLIQKGKPIILTSPFRYYTKGALCNYVDGAFFLTRGGPKDTLNKVKMIAHLETTQYSISYSIDSLIIRMPNTFNLAFKRKEQQIVDTLLLNPTENDSVQCFFHRKENSAIELIVKTTDDVFYVLPTDQLQELMKKIPIHSDSAWWEKICNWVTIHLVIGVIGVIGVLLLVIILFYLMNKNKKKIHYSWEIRRSLTIDLETYRLNDYTKKIILANKKNEELKIPVIELPVKNIDKNILNTYSIVNIGTENKLKIPINLSSYDSRLKQLEIKAKFGTKTACSAFKLNNTRYLPNEQDIEKLKAIDLFKDLFPSKEPNPCLEGIDFSTWTVETLRDKIAAEKDNWEASLTKALSEKYPLPNGQTKPSAKDTDLFTWITDALSNKVEAEKSQWEASLVEILRKDTGVLESDSTGMATGNEKESSELTLQIGAIVKKIKDLSDQNTKLKNNNSSLSDEINNVYKKLVDENETATQDKVKLAHQNDDNISAKECIRLIDEKIDSLILTLKKQLDQVDQLIRVSSFTFQKTQLNPPFYS